MEDRHDRTNSDRGENIVLTASDSAIANLKEDVGSLWCPNSYNIPILEYPPDSMTFLRDYVSKNIPCIIRNAMSRENMETMGQAKGLNLDDLVDMFPPTQEITVDVTPDGHGDCIRTVKAYGDSKRQRLFVKPQERKMTVKEFRSRLRLGRQQHNHNLQQMKREKLKDKIDLDDEGLPIYSLLHQTGNENRIDGRAVKEKESCSNTKESAVLYYSRQNDCLRTEWKALFEQKVFPESFSFAEEAFGTGAPDAINLWVGDERAVSSMHKDHYENLFYVMSGQKVFTLCPPADAPFLYDNEFESGNFCDGKEDNEDWYVAPDCDGEETDGTSSKDINEERQQECPRVRWIEANVEKMLTVKQDREYLSKYPLLRRTHPIQVLVNEGDMLYLPSLWFHRVTQTCETVGVNYWYDMRFDSPLWCYFNFMQQLSYAGKNEGDGTKK